MIVGILVGLSERMMITLASLGISKAANVRLGLALFLDFDSEDFDL
jgi:hypothetical protein